MENEEMEIMQDALPEEKLDAVNGGRRGGQSKGRAAKVQGTANEMWVVYRIGDPCVCCGICLENCPMGCIKAGEYRYSIDEDCCIGCGACAAYCPTGAIEKTYH